MLADQYQILQTVALLSCHGVRQVVLCPGSRNAPLVRTFAQCGRFECHAVTDERSAGFFALGLASAHREPVAVCCTSGSALLNLHPAVSEAYYRQLPLVVVSADRPAAWIGQMDGQTLPQPGVFGTLVKHAVNLPEPHNAEEEWYCNRLVNEALLAMTHGCCGPVHINVPISEPLFAFHTAALPQVRVIHRVEPAALPALLEAAWPRSGRVLAIGGQLHPQEAQAVAQALPPHTVWLTELLGNAPTPSQALRGFDTALDHSTALPQALQPELVVTFGGHIVSKRLKHALRRLQGVPHWHISADAQPADLFCHLTHVIATPAATFWQAVQAQGLNGSIPYRQAWTQACHIAPPATHYCAATVVAQVMAQLPAESVLHLANSSAVRLAEAAPPPPGVRVECNRGVNGIEGSVSAAVGFATASSLLNVLVVGDLSFFYDMNALWNAQHPANLHIVMLNNGQGDIFNHLPGLEMDATMQRFTGATHHTSARGWAEERGWLYRQVHNLQTLQEALETTDFFCAQSPQPVFVEVML